MELTAASEKTVLLISREELTEFAECVAKNILTRQEPPRADTQDDDRPLTQAEAQEFLGKSRQALVNWRRRGIINAYQINGRIYYKRAELLAALKKL